MKKISHPSGYYTLHEGFKSIDMKVVETFFTSDEAYWTKDDSTEDRLGAWQHSNCWALRDKKNNMVGGFRLITDRNFFGYVADVFVLPDHRGHALSEWMLEETFSSTEYKKVKRWALQTKDAHELYERLGFTAPQTPAWQMEKWRK